LTARRQAWRLIAVQGGDPPLSEPCEALSRHGYLGIEREVVGAIADWIKAKCRDHRTRAFNGILGRRTRL
jgi:hypothetical protein